MCGRKIGRPDRRPELGCFKTVLSRNSSSVALCLGHLSARHPSGQQKKWRLPGEGAVENSQPIKGFCRSFFRTVSSPVSSPVRAAIKRSPSPGWQEDCVSHRYDSKNSDRLPVWAACRPCVLHGFGFCHAADAGTGRHGSGSGVDAQHLVECRGLPRVLRRNERRVHQPGLHGQCDQCGHLRIGGGGDLLLCCGRL